MKIFIKIIVFFFLISVLFFPKVIAQDKVKIGLLLPLTGPNKEIGASIIKSVRLAINKIDNSIIEIIPKDTASNPEQTFKSAKELSDNGIKIIIGPIFNKNLIYLDELKEIIFLSLTNKVINNPKNIISAGINANSQLNTISKFLKTSNIKKTIFLLPKNNYKEEIEKAIKQSGIKIDKLHYYETEPTKLTKQIELITEYPKRKQRLYDEIKRLEESNENNKDLKIENLKKRDTIGNLEFDSVIISDFDESLKSITTSLLYTDVSPKKIYFITLNQWFDKSLLKDTSTQPIYFPSINKKNFEKFKNEYKNKFEEIPNELAFLSYDLVGLIYFLTMQNDFVLDNKIFLKENMFKGKIGIFEIKDNKINHILNFYKIEDNKFKRIF